MVRNFWKMSYRTGTPLIHRCRHPGHTVCESDSCPQQTYNAWMPLCYIRAGTEPAAMFQPLTAT